MSIYKPTRIPRQINITSGRDSFDITYWLNKTNTNYCCQRIVILRKLIFEFRLLLMEFKHWKKKIIFAYWALFL